MNTTTNSLGEKSWTITKSEGLRGTSHATFTRRNDEDGIEVVECFFPRRRGMIEHGFCGILSVEDARARMLSLRAKGWT